MTKCNCMFSHFFMHINIVSLIMIWNQILHPITPNISTRSYKHMGLYPSHRHMCLCPVDMYQLVTKSLRFKNYRSTVDFMTNYHHTGDLFIKLRLVFPWRVWNTELGEKCTQIIKVLDIKFTHFCLVMTGCHTVANF